MQGRISSLASVVKMVQVSIASPCGSRQLSHRPAGANKPPNVFDEAVGVEGKFCSHRPAGANKPPNPSRTLTASGLN
jgi:hypothetical protein